MSISRLVCIAWTAGALLAVPLMTAVAKAQSTPPSDQGPPAATAPQTTPPATPQATSPTAPAEKKVVAPVVTANLVGLSAKSSDGHNLGAVQSIREPGGKIRIGVKVGGFLGFGGHMVAIPDDKFSHIGDTVQVNMTADEINKLPRAIEQK